MHSIFSTLVGFSTVIFLIHIAVCFGLTVGLDRKKIGRKMQLYRFLGYFYPIFCLGFGIFSLIGQRWGEAIILLGSGTILFVMYKAKAREARTAVKAR